MEKEFYFPKKNVFIASKLSLQKWEDENYAINKIGYCGYTTNFPPSSSHVSDNSATARSFALLTSPAQLCLASRLLSARLCVEFFSPICENSSVTVAACLRGMWASSFNRKGHPRSFYKVN